MLRALCLWVLVFAAGCFRSTRVERLKAPVDTGVVQRFGDERGPQLKWDCGDGSPPVTARQLSRAFDRAGHYLVQGSDGSFVAWRIELEVVPRALPRAVPADAEALLYAPTLTDDFNPAVDFVERLVSAPTAQTFFEQSLLPAMAVEASVSGGQFVDAQEGVGLFTLPGFDGQVALLGVTDTERGLLELQPRLEVRGRVTTRDDGVRIAETLEGISAVAFADRGYLYVVLPDPGADALAVVARVRGADGLGLQAVPAFAGHQPSGNVFVYAAAPRQQADGPGLFEALHVGIAVSGQQARLRGEVLAHGPLFATPAQPTSPLFDSAAEGPVAALTVALPVQSLAAFLVGGAHSPRRQRTARRFGALGVDFERVVSAFSGQVAALAWFDAEAFLRNLVDGNQSPEPRGTVQFEAGLVDAAAVETALGRVFDAMAGPGLDYRRSGNASRWTSQYLGQPTALQVSPRALRFEGGSPLQGRRKVALSTELSERFDGAFGPGHASLLLDVGQLREELQTPRVIKGLDPTRVVTVQAFAAAFLEKITPVDHVLIDLVPSPTGATVSGRIVLKEREK